MFLSTSLLSWRVILFYSGVGYVWGELGQVLTAQILFQGRSSVQWFGRLLAFTGRLSYIFIP